MESASSNQQSIETHPGGNVQSISPQDMEHKISAMQNHIEDLLDRNTKSNHEIDSLVTTLKSRDAALAQEQQEKLQMNQRLALMEQQLTKSMTEKENLQAQTAELSQQLADTVRARFAVVLQLDECNAQKESIANSQKLQALELESLRSCKKNLEEQLLRLEAELSSLQCGTKEAQLEAKVQQMQFELQSSDEAVSGLKSLLVQEQARVQVLIEQLNAAQASEKAMQEFHAREVEAQARAMQLYQDESKEARAIAEELEKKLSEMQSMLREASEIRRDLEQRVEMDRVEWNNQVELKDKTIETLKIELSEAKTLLEQTKQDAIETYMEQMFPGAATLGRLLPPDLTFSKIFMEYSSATKQLDSVKDERDQLNLKLSFLGTELTERENELTACKAALQETQQECQKLQVEMRHLAHECHEAKNITQEAVRSATQHAKDKMRLQAQVHDLSAQVVRLLEAAEVKAETAPPVSPDAVDNLVLFRDVSELQHRNVELLAALRDMQQRAEQAENAVSNSQELGELQARLEEAKNEVRRLQNSSLSQEHLIEILVKQRDHFEKLSKRPEMKDMAVTTVSMVEKSQPQQQQQQQQQQPMRQPMTGHPTNVPPIVMELRGRLRKAEEALVNVNKDYDLFRQDSRNQFTMVTEQLENMRTSLSESKLAQAKLRAECESGKERLANARANISALTSQLEGMRSMREIQDKTIERHEKSLVELHKELVNTHTTLAQNEELLARLQSELRRLRISEGVLRNENDTMKKSSSTQQMVLQSAQELKACMLTAEAEQRLVLVQNLDTAEARNKQLKQTLEEVESRFAAEMAQLKSSLDMERASLEQAKAETLQAQGDVARLTERLAQAERDVLAMRAHRNAVMEVAVQTDLLGRDEQAAAEHLGALQQKVAAQTEELSALSAEIAKERTRVQNAETQVTVYETSLKMSRTEVAQRNATIETTKAEVEKLKNTVTTLESTLSEVRNEKNRLQMMFQNARGELSRVQGLLQKQNQAPPRQQPGAAAPVDTSALDALQEELVQAREQIERLETQHKQDLNAISTFRKQVVTANTKLEQVKSQLEELNEAERLKEKHTPESAESKAELLAMQEQNKTLLDQVYAQGMELCTLKQSTADTSGGDLNTSGRSLKEEDAHTPEQMLQVLKHLRREREVALSRLESLEAKVKGLCVQLEASERQLREAREHAGGKSGQLKGDMVELTAERYREISQKLETLNALADSNITQREKCAKLEQQVTSLQAELTAMGNMKEEYTTCKANLDKAVEKLKAQQDELVAVRGEAVRWRSRANQLTERANQANNQEIKRLQTELSNLQQQLNMEREELQRCRATVTERESEVTRLNGELSRVNGELTRVNGELSKVNTELARVNSEVTRVSGELSAAQEKIKALEEEKATLDATLATKETQLKDITNKELQVRRIAKKYKGQYEELLKTNEAEKATQQQAAATAGPSREQQEMTSKLEELENRARDAEHRAVQAETTAAAKQEEVNKAEAKVTELQHQVAEKQRESASWEERSERMKSVLQTARQRIGEGNANVDRLQQELNATNTNLESQRQAKEEAEAKAAALELRLQAQVARLQQQIQHLEQENAALQRNLSDSEQSAPQSAARQQQGAKSGATTTLTSDKSSGETPTANIRPMAGPSQIKLQQQSHQSATVPPTSRTAPMARLRPMSMGPRSMAVAPSQQQTATPSSSSSSGTVAVAPMQGVQSTSEASTSTRPTAASVAPSGREEAAVEPSTSQQENTTEEQAPVSAGATVVLVRPQEVQPAVSSSQSLQSVSAPPSTSRPPPTLKRSRDEPATRSEEPQVKHACMEVTSGNAEAVAVVAPSLQEEPSSSHGQAFEAMITSNEEPEREADAQEVVGEPGDSAAPEEDAPMENETSEVVDSDSQNEVLIIDEEIDNGNQAEPSSSSGPSPSARHSELFRAVEALLDSGAASSAQSEPTSSSTVSLPRPPTLRAPQAHLVLPQQQGYEEIGDDSIVPSTPTLFVPRRREGFGEGVSSPQVPQSQGRLFTFAPESTPSPMSAPQVSASGGSETLEEARLEAADDPGTGRSVPSTPLLISPQDMVPSIAPSVESQPQETPEVTESVPSEVDVPSSSSVPVIMVTPAASQEHEVSRTPPDQAMQADEQETVQQTVPSPSVRGLQSRGSTARRSPQQRGNNRPRAPIVWNENQVSQHPRGQGRGRMSPRLMRRGMMPRGSPGSPGSIPPLLSRGSTPGHRMGNSRPIRRPF